MTSVFVCAISAETNCSQSIVEKLVITNSSMFSPLPEVSVTKQAKYMYSLWNKYVFTFLL